MLLISPSYHVAWRRGEAFGKRLPDPGSGPPSGSRPRGYPTGPESAGARLRQPRLEAAPETQRGPVVVDGDLGDGDVSGLPGDLAQHVAAVPPGSGREVGLAASPAALGVGDPQEAVGTDRADGRRAKRSELRSSAHEELHEVEVRELSVACNAQGFGVARRPVDDDRTAGRDAQLLGQAGHMS